MNRETAARLEALDRTSADLQELLGVASKTAALLADSLEPSCSPEVRGNVRILAERYRELLTRIRDSLIEQSSAILGQESNEGKRSAAEMNAPPNYVGDPSLAARTEAEITARKVSVLASRLQLPDTAQDDQTAMI